MVVFKGSPEDEAQPQRGPALSHVARGAQRWLGKKAKKPDPEVLTLLDDAEGMTERPTKYRKLSDHVLSGAAAVRVQTSDDLLHGEADSNKLRAWLSIIALGKKVQPMDSPAILHKPALNDTHKLCFSPSFAIKHARVVRSYGGHARHSERKWTTAPAAQYPAKGYVNVDTLDDFRQWMISARRLSSWAGVGVKGATVLRGEISRYGRRRAQAA